VGVWGQERVIEGMNMINTHYIYGWKYLKETPYFVQFIYTTKNIFKERCSFKTDVEKRVPKREDKMTLSGR
jgi:hypothetical protein